MQNFAFFADQSRSATIKPRKIFAMRMRKGKGGSTLRTAGTGSKMALYYLSLATNNLLDPKGPLSKKMHTYVGPMRKVARPGYGNGCGSMKHKRENKNHENLC